MKKNDPWVSSLFSLIFIAIPALVIFYFLLPSWTGKEIIKYGYMYLIFSAFIIYSLWLTFTFIKFEFLAIESLNFNIPLSISLMSMLLTYKLPIWLIFIFVLISVLTAFPVNIWTNGWRSNKIKKKTYLNSK